MNDSPRLRGNGDYSPPPVVTSLCPTLSQVHGSRLRLSRVSPADSGEYVCRVENESGPKEASIIVSVFHSTHSGPSYTPGEEGLPTVPREGACGLLGNLRTRGGALGRLWGCEGTDSEDKVDLAYLGPHGEDTVSGFARKWQSQD